MQNYATFIDKGKSSHKVGPSVYEKHLNSLNGCDGKTLPERMD